MAARNEPERTPEVRMSLKTMVGMEGALTWLQGANYRGNELISRGTTTHVTRQAAAFVVDLMNRPFDTRCHVVLAEMPQQQNRREDQRGRIRRTLTRDIGRRAVDGFEQRALVAEVGAGNEAKPAYQAGAEVGDDVAVEVFEQQHVKLLRTHHELHAAIVDDHLAVLDAGVFFRDAPDRVEKQAVRELHDVGLMDGRDFLPSRALRVFKSKARDTRRGALGDDLQALDHAGRHDVLEAGVEILSVLTHHDEVEIVKGRADTRQLFHRPEVGVEVELLAQRHVEALVSAAHGRRQRAFEPHPGAPQRLDHRVKAGIFRAPPDHRRHFALLPLDIGARGFEQSKGGGGYFGSDAVARNESYDRRGRRGVSHTGHCSSKCGSGGTKPDWQRPSPPCPSPRGGRGERILDRGSWPSPLAGEGGARAPWATQNREIEAGVGNQ